MDMREIYLLWRRKASTNLCDSMTYMEKIVPVARAFVLDKEISSRLELSRLTRCTRPMTPISRESVPPEADSLARNRASTPNRTTHPEVSLLELFMRGELSGASGRAECRMIVRHLLTGCPQCARITGRLWGLGDLPGESPPLVD